MASTASASLKSEWRQLDTMRPYVKGLPMVADGGEPWAPNSCSTDNNLTVLEHWFRVLQPATTLEIGLAFGASATLLLSLHRMGGADSKHHAIDPFQRKYWRSVALRHIESSGLAPWFRFHESPSALMLPKLVESGSMFDLIYIDGSHLFEDVFVDFYFCHLLLKMGGVIAFDDSSCPHVRKVIRFIKRNLSEDYEEHSPYLVTAPKHARLKTFAARLMGRQQLTVFQKRHETPRYWGTPFHDF